MYVTTTIKEKETEDMNLKERKDMGGDTWDSLGWKGKRKYFKLFF